MITAKIVLFVLLLSVLVFNGFSQTNVSGVISTNTNWAISGSPYILTADVTVNSGVTLTIDPGVQIFFSSGDDLLISGTLTAVGNATDSIFFFGEIADDGVVELLAGSTAQFDYVSMTELGDNINGRGFAIDIETTNSVTVSNSRFFECRNAIRVNFDATPTISGNVFETSNIYAIDVVLGDPTITGNTITGTGTNGIHLLDTATIQNNLFLNNGDFTHESAILIDGVLVPVIENNTFTGNIRDIITHPEIMDDAYFDNNGISEIHIDNNKNITQNTTWHFPVSTENWNYELLGDVTVDAGITLTVEAGVVMHFSSDDELKVNGTLIANGNSVDSIFFIGEGADDGVVDLLAGSTAQFDYVSMTELGDNINGRGFAIEVRTTNSVSINHSKFYGCRNGLRVRNNSTPTILNSVFENSNLNGISVEDGSPSIDGSIFTGSGDAGIYLLDTATISNSTFSNNGISFEDCGLHIDEAIVPVLDNNTFANNYIDVITHPEIVDDEVFDTNGLTEIYIDNKSITVNTTWQEPVLPEDWVYRVIGDITVNAGVTLSIEPGVWVYFGSNDDIFVDGTLVAVGTAADSIRFIGETTNDGGIDLRAGSNATFDYSVFDEMGDDIGGRLNALYKRGTGTVTMDHSRFTGNRNGIQVSAGASITVDNSTFEGSNENGINVLDGSMTMTNSLVRNNLDKGVYLLDTATIQNTTFSGNGVNSEDCGLHIEAAIVPVLDNNTFTGNYIDVITHPEIVDDEIFDTNGLTDIYLDNQAITVNTSWQEPILPEDWNYRVIGDITVNAGVTLTIEPGVWVYFGSSDDIFVDGTLVAVGTAADSIRFIGETTNDGGIDLRAGSNATFDYSVFDEMGDDIGGRLNALYKRGAGTVTMDHSRFTGNRNGIQVSAGASITVDNSTFEGSNENGINVLDGTLTLTNSLVRNNLDKGVYLLDTATIQNTTFSGNGVNSEDCGLHIEAAIVPVLDNNTFTGNYIDVITHPEIVDDEIFDTNGLTDIFLDNQAITVNTSWQEPILPEDWNYRVIGDITVNAGVTLSIEPGVWVYFGSNDDIFVDGTLVAVGTAADSIRFIGETTNDGGIDLRAGSSATFDYSVFDEMGDDIGGRLNALYKRGAGTVTMDHSRFTGNRNGIQVSAGASITVDNSTFEGSNENGINVLDGTLTLTNSLVRNNLDKGVYLLDTATIQNTTFSGNGVNSEDCGLHIEAAIVPVLDNNTFTGNYIDVITHPEIVDDEIFDTNGLTDIYLDNQAITVNTSWQEPILPEDWNYRVIGDITVNAGVTLTIEPGVWVYFGSNDDLFINGSLIAEGTIDNTIQFIGETTNDGGIDLLAGSSASIDYVVFNEMGDDIGGRLHALYIKSSAVSVDNCLFENCRRGIYIDNGAVPDITSTIVRASNEYGIYIENGSPVITESRFEGSGITGIQVVSGDPTISGSCIFGNSSFGINNTGTGTVDARNNWWGDITGPRNDSLNATGLGDIMSANVLFDPWTTVSCDLVIGPPVIVIDVQPEDSLMCEGNDASFSLSASGDTGIGYQWQVDQGSGYVDLINTGIYGGVTTSSLQLFNVPQTYSGYNYRCVVSGDIAVDLISDEVTLYVNTSPADPILLFSDSTICSATSLDLVASGGTEPSYLWYESSTSTIPVQNDNIGLFSTGLIDRDTTFYVSIREFCESNRVPINIYLGTPAITTQPTDIFTSIGEDVVFSVVATGSSLSYQWQKDGVDMAFQTLPDLSLESVILADEGDYTCVITNSCGQLISETATLTIGTPPVPEFTLSILEDVQQVEVSGSADLGETEILMDLSRDFVIDNTGTIPIVVLGITSSNSKFSVENIPSSIDVQSSEAFNLIFNSDQVGRDSTNLTIQFQDSTVTLWVFAEAIPEPGNNPEVVIYNAVAPNGDGKHDFFKIENIEYYPNNVVEIFNRWGDKVYEITSYDNGDSNHRFEGIKNIGTSGDLVEGTYFYLIDLKDGTKVKTGFLLLKR
ncbi:MAG: right-handed parallel beta-helix repeat-containing protein [Bacteroidota bacterium]